MSNIESYYFDVQAEVSEKRGFLVSEGLHLFAVVDVEPKKGAKGLYLNVEFMVIGGANDPDNEREIRYQTYSFADNARWRVAELFRAIDPKMKGFDVTNRDLLDEHLLGRVLAAEVVHKDNTYQGKTTKKQSLESHRALSPAERQRLFDLYGEMMIPMSLINKFNGVLGEAADGSKITEDDIPF